MVVMRKEERWKGSVWVGKGVETERDGIGEKMEIKGIKGNVGWERKNKGAIQEGMKEEVVP